MALPHPTLMLSGLHTVNDRGLTHLDLQLAPSIDLEFDRFFVGDVRDRSCDRHAVYSCQEIHSPDGEHLGAVLFRDNQADLSFACHHRRSLFTDRDVRVDFDHDPAVTEGSLRHHGHHIDIVLFSFNDVRGWLAVGIGCACSDAGD